MECYPIITTLIEGGYAQNPGESSAHAALRCALERLTALEASRSNGNYLTVITDPEGTYEAGDYRYTAILMGDPTGGVGADPEPLASLSGIDVAPPHSYYTVVEADLALEVIPAGSWEIKAHVRNGEPVPARAVTPEGLPL